MGRKPSQDRIPWRKFRQKYRQNRNNQQAWHRHIVIYWPCTVCQRQQDFNRKTYIGSKSADHHPQRVHKAVRQYWQQSNYRKDKHFYRKDKHFCRKIRNSIRKDRHIIWKISNIRTEHKLQKA